MSDDAHEQEPMPPRDEVARQLVAWLEDRGATLTFRYGMTGNWRTLPESDSPWKTARRLRLRSLSSFRASRSTAGVWAVKFIGRETSPGVQ